MLSLCAYPFSKIAVICRDLTWPRKSPKLNLHHLRNISTGFKMAVLTTKSGIRKCYWRIYYEVAVNFFQTTRWSVFFFFLKTYTDKNKKFRFHQMCWKFSQNLETYLRPLWLEIKYILHYVLKIEVFALLEFSDDIIVKPVFNFQIKVRL